MTGIYRIAEKNIEITSLYEQVHIMCREYQTEGSPDLTVEITEPDIAVERQYGDAYSEEYLETLAVYRRIAEAMPQWDTVLFHGSSVAVDNCAYIFTAPSGTGKSTHVSLWRDLLKERAVMINDDKPLIRISEDSVTVFGTPWNGKHHLGENIAVPLKAICFLGRGKENAIFPVSSSEAYLRMLHQVYRPADSLNMRKTLGLMDRLCHQVAFYRLACNMDISAAVLSYETMSKEKHKMKLSKDFIVHKTDRETILVPIGGTGFSGIMKGNSTLGDILTLLGEDISEDALLKAMMDQYDAPETVIARDVAKALSELRAIGALDE